MSAKAFNEMMNQFLGDLERTFPDEQAIKAVKAAPPTMNDFMTTVRPWSDKIGVKDDAFFTEDNPFVKSLNLHEIWKSSDATAQTKDAIWQYMSSLFFMGTMQSLLPPDMMSMIESTAENLARNMESGGMIDQNTISRMAAQIVNGSMGARPQPRRRIAKPSKKSR